MIFPYDINNVKDSATIEHLNENGPFYWKDNLNIDNVVICCGSRNSSRGKKNLFEWFKSNYCISKNINQYIVVDLVKKFLNNN